MDFDSGINHKKWQLFLIPLVSLFAALFILFGSRDNQTQWKFPWRTFLTVSVFTYAIWQVNLIPYKILDKRMAFYEQPGKRLLTQIFCCLGATWVTFTFFYILITLIESGTIGTAFTSGFVLFFLIATGISLAVNALYVIRYLQATLRYKEAISTERMNELVAEIEKKAAEREAFNDVDQTKIQQPVVKRQSLLVPTGNKIQNIFFDDIAYWYSSDGIVTLVLNDGKKMTTNFSSYSELIDLLPGELFFQLSRQFLVHIQSIHSIQDDKNRKLLVELKTKILDSKAETVTVSRYRSQQLKSWFVEAAKTRI